MPGAQLLQLPTVVVDVEASAGRYETMTLYSCITKLGVRVNELIFATRSPIGNSTQLAAMEAKAKSLGVQWDSASLSPVSHTGCK